LVPLEDVLVLVKPETVVGRRADSVFTGVGDPDHSADDRRSLTRFRSDPSIGARRLGLGIPEGPR